MATPSELSERIAEIDAILRTGARSVTLDGVTISYDFDQLREERRTLEAKQPDARKRRRFAFRNNLGGSA